MNNYYFFQGVFKSIVIFLLLYFVVLGSTFAQIEITVRPAFDSDNHLVARSSAQQFTNKFKNAISTKGYYSEFSSRFILKLNPSVAEIHPNSNSLLVKYIVQVELIDRFADQSFYSFDFVMGGAGKTEKQAFADALNRLDFNNLNLSAKMEEGIQKVKSYYAKNCQRILEQGKNELTAGNYEKAMYMVSLIPQTENQMCSAELNKMILLVWKEYTKFNCTQIINQANLLWSTNSTVEGAYEVADLLRGVNIANDCQGQFESLISSIKTKLINDQFDERRFRELLIDKSVELEKSKIQAMSNIASAYYYSQKSDNYILY